MVIEWLMKLRTDPGNYVVKIKGIKEQGRKRKRFRGGGRTSVRWAPQVLARRRKKRRGSYKSGVGSLAIKWWGPFSLLLFLINFLIVIILCDQDNKK